MFQVLKFLSALDSTPLQCTEMEENDCLNDGLKAFVTFTNNTFR